jgi:uncharacterized protein (DUF2235 family)
MPSVTPKRLVVCCDGTWNRPDQLDHGLAAPTNVSKLALAVARQDDAGVEQVVFYVRGVGTRRFQHLRGGAFGIGLSRNVREAYRFLVENYEPGDELFLFGFSRGAFTARSTAGLVRNSGIVRREHAARIDEAYGLYRGRDNRTKPNGIDAALFRRMYSHPDADIHFIGVWDTVGALGIPIDGFRPPFITKRWSFHDTTLSSHVRAAYHALSIDERRGPFKPTLWEQQPAARGQQTLEQVWFAGVHCDVGGGYADPALGEIPLLWMADRARDNGLALEPDRLGPVDADRPDPALRAAGVQVAPDPLGAIHESLKGFYRLMRPYQRPLEADGGALASSVVRRRDAPAAKYATSTVATYLAADRPVTTVKP